MRFPTLLLAAALVVSACDGTDPVETFTGPTVEFGTSSLNAAEGDGTVEIPVRLTNGTGGSVTVEVLYAAASSTTDYDADLDGFGSEAGPNRVTTVTLSGESDTQTVSIDVVDDGEAETPEAAVFVLQRATGGARIGDTREFRLEIGTPPIATIRQRELGEVVTVEGIVTRARGRFSYIQDGTAALGTFANGDDYFNAIASGAIRQGDRVQIVGELGEFNGLLQIGSISAFEVLSRDNELPEAQVLTPAEILNLGDDVETELVRVEGLVLNSSDVLFTGNTSYTVEANGTGITLRTSRDTDSEIVDETIVDVLGGAPGAYGPFTFEGVVGQFGGNNQLAAVNLSDFIIE